MGKLIGMFVVAFGLAALTGCSELRYASMPSRFPRFPSASSFGGVWLEARFFINHEQVFRENLLEYGVVPVAVRVFLRGDEGVRGNPRILLEDIRPQLYLPDGTALAHVSYDRIEIDEATADRITAEALDTNVIKSEERSELGFIFFSLPRGQFVVMDSNTLVSNKTPLPQELRISDSLLAFEYFTDEDVRPIYVGLRKDRR